MQPGAQRRGAGAHCPRLPWDPWVESDSRKGRQDGTVKAQLGQGRDRSDCHLGTRGNVENGPGMEVFPRRRFSKSFETKLLPPLPTGN